ncbi:hypothetical protein PG995_006262 [Apiospora arundinis]
MNEYRSYEYRSRYTDLLIIVSTGTSNTHGWLRNQVFEFDPQSNLTDLWDPIFPPGKLNSLWYWTQCELVNLKSNTCGSVLGIPNEKDKQPLNKTNLRLWFGEFNDDEKAQGYTRMRGELDIESCFAKPPESCKIMVSNDLLLVVLSCVLVKVVTCIVVLWNQQDASLVTPGDAIESFITNPDVYTYGLATLNITDSQGLQCSARKEVVSESRDASLKIRPRRWNDSSRRLRSAGSKGSWIQIYYPTSLALVSLLVGVITSSLYGFSSDDGITFGPSNGQQTIEFLEHLGYVATLIVVNMPQLILSFVYLVINSLYTQMQVEKEWNSYGLANRPLRVSYPHGQQTSTYRLQLPYKYSIPLLTTSALLHWVVSNCLFILIVDGRWEGRSRSSDQLRQAFDQPQGTIVSMGYSALAVVILFALGALFVLSPFFFASTKLKSGMPSGGTDSLVLSAACHVPRAERHITEQGHEQNNLRGIEDDTEYLVALSRQPLRWGVTVLPADLSQNLLVDDDEPVMHLSFGSEDHDVREPQAGALYA